MIKINGCLARDTKNNSLCVNCANGNIINYIQDMLEIMVNVSLELRTV